MRIANLLAGTTLAAIAALWGCSGSSGSSATDGGSTALSSNSGGTPSGGTSTGAPDTSVNTGGSVAAAGGRTASGGAPITGGSLASGGAPLTGGSPAAGGSTATGGSNAATGGAATGGKASATGGSISATGGKANGGATSATGGKASGVGGALTGGTTSSSGQGGTTTVNTSGACTIGTWPTADPSKTGPFAITTENNVGPQAGVGVDGGTPPQFTLFRPKDMTQGGLCHPVITWGNGTGATPNMYSGLLNTVASHGFVVIASNSTNVAQGSPAPMLAGVTWVIDQNSDPTSALYQSIDTTHIGAMGHSQGAMATTTAGADSRITAIAPICGAMTQTLHGPAILLCGGNDTIVPCSGMVQTAYNGIKNQPVMLADYLTGDHGNWMTFGTAALSPVETAALAWMRVHLMGDTSLRSRFYGADCTLCQDPAWQIQQKMMDQ